MDKMEAFGFKDLKPGQYLWRDVPDSAGPERVVVSLTDQMAYLYRGDTLMAISTISTETPHGSVAWSTSVLSLALIWSRPLSTSSST